jgi:hypothetical protein
MMWLQQTIAADFNGGKVATEEEKGCNAVDQEA